MWKTIILDVVVVACGSNEWISFEKLGLHSMSAAVHYCSSCNVSKISFDFRKPPKFTGAALPIKQRIFVYLLFSSCTKDGVLLIIVVLGFQERKRTNVSLADWCQPQLKKRHSLSSMFGFVSSVECSGVFRKITLVYFRPFRRTTLCSYFWLVVFD